MAGVLRAKDNPVVFFDLHANKQKVGRATFELFHDLCPKAAENFRQFCTGEFLWKGRPTGYKDTCFHKVVEDKFMEGGDFINSGVGSRPRISIWGEDQLFEDESFEVKHSEAGLLSLVNLGMKEGNGNLFLVTLGACPELDGKSVIFGQATDEQSLKVVRSLSAVAVNSEYRPKYPVVIRECGQM
jgi:peptidyl-prolyl isomerase H (cyclophilin H)